jgi:hypothetical protein
MIEAKTPSRAQQQITKNHSIAILFFARLVDFFPSRSRANRSGQYAKEKLEVSEEKIICNINANRFPQWNVA